MIRSILLSFLAMLALNACEPQSERPSREAGYPALWEIASETGNIEGWLFGTIHSLPDGIEWRSAELAKVVAQADSLVVEVSNLDDSAELSGIFERMAFDRPGEPIRSRIEPEFQDEFDILLVKSGVRASYFDAMESWAAALALAQIAQDGEAGNGVDRALIAEFRSRETIELEGAYAQLSIFDGLPEKEQRDLLNAVLVESLNHKEKGSRLSKAWRSGDIEELSVLIQQGMLADPELKQALLIDRNNAWAAKIENLLSAEERPLIAVGAGHMVGAEGLPSLLQKNGYTIRRIH